MRKKTDPCFQATTIYQVPVTSTGSRVYLSYSSRFETLFASFPNEKVVLAKRLQPRSPGNDESWFPVAGNSKQCLGNMACGDGGKATEASLAFPKVKSGSLGVGVGDCLA